jgi:heme/copper-type cytochrome/quinol oxidase subunit 4
MNQLYKKIIGIVLIIFLTGIAFKILYSTNEHIQERLKERAKNITSQDLKSEIDL